VLYSPLAWVRTLDVFSTGFVFSMGCIALAVVTTSAYCFHLIIENDGKPAPGFKPIGDDYWDMVGFAFFMFEGIGCLMPVMQETLVPEKFATLTTAALVTLCTIYVLFAFLCYYAWGDSLDESVVTEMLPPDNWFVQVVKLLYCVNLVFSYPITIVPAHDSFQEWIFGQQYGGRFGVREERALYWKVNILRSAILLGILLITLYVADILDKVISIAGAILGMTNVLLFPALCHLKLIAETPKEKLFDQSIIVFSCIMIVFMPTTIILSW
jgi:hypothetical protein